jgi:hypothetical protein
MALSRRARTRSSILYLRSAKRSRRPRTVEVHRSSATGGSGIACAAALCVWSASRNPAYGQRAGGDRIVISFYEVLRFHGATPPPKRELEPNGAKCHEASRNSGEKTHFPTVDNYLLVPLFSISGLATRSQALHAGNHFPSTPRKIVRTLSPAHSSDSPGRYT